MAFTFTTTVTSISYLGGSEVLLTSAAWPASVPLSATLTDTTAGHGSTVYPCETGRNGQMTAFYPLGTKLYVYMPQLPANATSATLTIKSQDGTQSYTAQLAVTPPFYGSFTFGLRSLLPSTFEAGARNIAQLDESGGY